MTTNPFDSDSSAGICSAKMDDATWFDEFTIELRLLAVPGSDIGDALASAREFLADAGTSAQECFGSPRSYAAELRLSTIPQPAVNGVGLRAGLGLLGLIGFMVSALPLAARRPDRRPGRRTHLALDPPVPRRDHLVDGDPVDCDLAVRAVW